MDFAGRKREGALATSLCRAFGLATALPDRHQAIKALYDFSDNAFAMWFAQSLSLPSLYRYSFLCARPVYNDNGCGSILPSCSAGRTQRGAYETTLIFLSIALFSSLAV